MTIGEFLAAVAATKKVSDKEIERLFVGLEIGKENEAGEILDLLHIHRPELAEKLKL